MLVLWLKLNYFFRRIKKSTIIFRHATPFESTMPVWTSGHFKVLVPKHLRCLCPHPFTSPCVVFWWRGVHVSTSIHYFLKYSPLFSIECPYMPSVFRGPIQTRANPWEIRGAANKPSMALGLQWNDTQLTRPNPVQMKPNTVSWLTVHQG